MMGEFPIGASDIGLKWVIEEGGIGVVAATDDVGLPYIGLYPINRMGLPNGLPVRFQKSRLMIGVVVGFRFLEPLVVFIDAEVNRRGLSLITCAPRHIAPRGYPRHQFAPWGNEPPRYGYAVFPANSNWLFFPCPEENF